MRVSVRYPASANCVKTFHIETHEEHRVSDAYTLVRNCLPEGLLHDYRNGQLQRLVHGSTMLHSYVHDGADELFVTVYYLADGTTWQAIRADTGLLASTTLPPSIFTPTEYAITEAKDMWKAQKRRNEALADHLRKELLDLEEDHRARQALKRSRRTK